MCDACSDRNSSRNPASVHGSSSFFRTNMVGYIPMQMRQVGMKKQTPVKVAEKNLHCFSCGGQIRKGSVYVRKDFVKTHYQQCPVGELVLPE
jgi:hypothetical protein